eukprot:TRINITY_DN21049_c0_g3_i1.p1 TRINITY_DN21049_c0_g3~~TRINITY_DN21049_c0_g3_i1.p1  ORF type:complete len:158 (-),score=30.13 TRINITY_DN21049_c0_g3_i1:713-1186(-)
MAGQTPLHRSARRVQKLQQEQQESSMPMHEDTDEATPVFHIATEAGSSTAHYAAHPEFHEETAPVNPPAQHVSSPSREEDSDGSSFSGSEDDEEGGEEEETEPPFQAGTWRRLPLTAPWSDLARAMAHMPFIPGPLQTSEVFEGKVIHNLNKHGAMS